jgi:hypothetical protein
MVKKFTEEEVTKAIHDCMRSEMARMHHQYNPLSPAILGSGVSGGSGVQLAQNARALFPPAPQENAVHVEYIPVENGYVVNITKNRSELPKVYVAKDLAEAHELVTTYMVKERLSK